MENIIKRLKSESNGLLAKINKLDTFINASETYKALCCKDKRLLKKQLRHMLAYHSILAERIARMGQISNTKKDA